MATGIIENKSFSNIAVEDISVESIAENIITVQALFDIPVTGILTEVTKTTAVFSKQEINITIANPEPFVIVVEKPTTITVVEDNEIKLFIADEHIPKNTPVIILDNGNVATARTNTLNSYNRFVGINTADVTTGNQARVKISGTLFDANFNWDINKEIYLSETGELTQNPSINAVYLQQIANVLTPNLILITHSEPVQY